MFIKTYHPKTSMAPTRESIQKILSMGWVAQAKKNGFRAQVHITKNGVINYTRHGSAHTRPLPLGIVNALKALFPVGTVVMGEWVQHEQKLYLFDFLKKDGLAVQNLNYAERHKLLPQNIEGAVEVLPCITDVETAYAVLMDEVNEGLVFRSITTSGFPDSSIIRCRRNGVTFVPQRKKKA